MTDEIYQQLADALDRLPNRYPRTETGVEIRILKKIFTPEEAQVASHLTKDMEPAEEIALKAGMKTQELSQILLGMAKRGLIWFSRQDDRAVFRLAPFVVGFYEAQLDTMDHELAHLVEAYMAGGGAAAIMGPEPALHRVLPTQKTVKTEWILPYEDVREILSNAKTYHVEPCICRKEQELNGHKCDFPKETCLSFSNRERAPIQGDLSREEALKFLDWSEEIGLVHTVSNVIDGLTYVCNCCGCCCGILRGINDWGIENSVAFSNYFSIIDADACSGCGVCIERCQVHAISEQDGFAVVERSHCIGCGLCVSGCTTGAARLELRTENERIIPPMDFTTWEQQRLSQPR
jgi:electron transport complex protein RnfB